MESILEEEEEEHADDLNDLLGNKLQARASGDRPVADPEHAAVPRAR